MLLAAAGGLLGWQFGRAQRLRQQGQERRRAKCIRDQFDPVDGSHRALTRLVTGAMYDPSTYKHLETEYGDEGDHLTVRMTFEGSGPDGEIMRNWVEAKVGLDGGIESITGQGP